MTLTIDIDKGREVAKELYDIYHAKGIRGVQEMPEDALPEKVDAGSLEHILFLTLTVSIDYMRDAHTLWSNAKKAFNDPDTTYLFNPNALANTSFEMIKKDLQKFEVSLRSQQDTWIWNTVGKSFYSKWNSDPRNFFADCNWNAPTILGRLKADTHPEGDRLLHDFPFLSGDKIGPLWMRMMRDNANIVSFTNLAKVPIPVDVHVARSTFSLGIVKGQYEGQMKIAYEKVREAWFKSVRGIKIGNRDMIALDVDESLWHLSKLGCTVRDIVTGECIDKENCELQDYCVQGKVRVSKGYVEVDT